LTWTIPEEERRSFDEGCPGSPALEIAPRLCSSLSIASFPLGLSWVLAT
jgi:hypothetical protein